MCRCVRFTNYLRWMLGCAALLPTLLGCDHEQRKLDIEILQPFAASGNQWETQTTVFNLPGSKGNPFDPNEISVVLEITDPLGNTRQHPGFYTHDHEIVVDHNHEVTRDQGLQHWEIRWSPSLIGTYRWRMLAASAGQEATRSGEFHCVAGTGRGFVRVSETDGRFFETSNGDFLFPIGHGTRSPHDERWVTDRVPTAASATHVTLKYEEWFKRMSANGENCCVLWMAPWSLGLEWSLTGPGYGGLGHYNQIHAAQLDRIFDLAQQYGIYVILYEMNHGQLSTVIDAEWYRSPYRLDQEGNGLVMKPSDYFHSEECRRLHSNRLRYILARWGHSPMLFAIVLCTELNWIDPYNGLEAKPGVFFVEGAATETTRIHKEHNLIARYFASLSDYVSQIDVHDHLVTVQFALLSTGNEFWSDDRFDIMLNNFYTPQFRAPQVSAQLGREAEGVVDGLWAYAKHFSALGNQPLLVAEWGGHHVNNSRPELATQHHAGIWASALSGLSGVTGFWWWSAVNELNLYPQYAALDRFLAGHDRRGKNLESTLGGVEIKLPNLDEVDLPEFAQHPSRDALLLIGDRELMAYVYHQDLNTADRFAFDQRSRYFPVEAEAFLKLPQRLKKGEYRVEFWDPFAGEVLETRRVALPDGEQGPRRIALRPFRVDLAIKIQRAQGARPDTAGKQISP